ncbi:MAG: AAA family ATPase [Bacilli bacterium]|uniref:AAA family ATPase n=1 Tax=Acinetobacter sp. ANC 5414 TaxID=2731251 RepID=UPI00148FFACB|nr:AAA family ATPase [Acinetobacter sp. ANC 5414]NNH01990.1 hypothetical protein [Acinetobacter sp. ANC 5414]
MSPFGIPSIQRGEIPLMLFHFKTLEGTRKYLDLITPECKYLITLEPSDWDDFGYKTIFEIQITNNLSQKSYKLGSIKIGYANQGENPNLTTWTIDHEFINGKTLEKLEHNFFSMGIDFEYYERINEVFNYDDKTISHFYNSLNDVAYNKKILNYALKYDVFKISFLRSTSYENIIKQFSNIARRKIISNKMGITLNINDDEISFHLSSNSNFKNNIKVLIGSNGSGKSELLNKIVEDYINNNVKTNEINNIILVSFSPFDKLLAYKKYIDSDNNKKSVRLIGLKSEKNISQNTDLELEFLESVGNCLFSSFKKDLLIKLIYILSSDPILSNFNFKDLITKFDSLNINKNDLKRSEIFKLFDILSSGHKIVIYTLFKLVDLVDRNTLVLYDEPELYLHPPLLSAYLRAFSELLIQNNAMAIITTHSPVVLQEVPKIDIKIIRRYHDLQDYDEVNLETFGERVDILTNEVFNLEVYNSGYYKIIFELFQSNKYKFNSVDHGYEFFLEYFKNQLGSEAKNVILSLLNTYFDNQRNLK